MFYKGYIIKDGKIPMSDYTLTEEGLENILKHQDIPFVNSIYEKVGTAKLVRVDYIALDIFDKEQRIKEPDTVESMRLSRYFKAEEAYAKKNQTTDNGTN